MYDGRLGVTAALVDGAFVRGDLSVREGRVERVGLAPRAGAAGTAVPGFVDCQVNGFAGVDFRTATQADLERAADALAVAGIVRIAPTLHDATVETYCAALEVLGEYRRRHPSGALLGAHLEGPNLSRRWRGSHDEANLVGCEVSLVRRFLAAGPVAMATIAPELPGAMEVLAAWRAAGVSVGLGHTDAELACCRLAGEAGASALTHCWNAHRPLSARDPGPAGWALHSPGVSVGLIADGHHVAPEVLAITFAAAPGRVAVTSDALAVAGTDGADARSDPPRRADGTLAGSVATPGVMIGVLEDAGVGFVEAVHALSVPQARLLGLGANLLRPGDRADVTVLAQDRSVLSCWRAGTRLA